jgi:hypothetical protein
MDKTVFLLQKGATVFGVYTSLNLATEARAEWADEFMRRFDRTPRFLELPVMHEMLLNGVPARSVVVMEGAN